MEDIIKLITIDQFECLFTKKQLMNIYIKIPDILVE